MCRDLYNIYKREPIQQSKTASKVVIKNRQKIRKYQNSRKKKKGLVECTQNSVTYTLMPHDQRVHERVFIYCPPLALMWNSQEHITVQACSSMVQTQKYMLQHCEQQRTCWVHRVHCAHSKRLFFLHSRPQIQTFNLPTIRLLCYAFWAHPCQALEGKK